MRRAWICFGLSLCLFVGCVWYGPPEKTETAQPVSVYLEDRAQVRKNCLAELNALIADAQAAPDIRKMAREKKLALISGMEQEASIEALLGYMGYGTCAVSVGENSVLAAVGSVSTEDTARILDLIRRETGQPAENIRILPMNFE